MRPLQVPPLDIPVLPVQQRRALSAIEDARKTCDFVPLCVLTARGRGRENLPHKPLSVAAARELAVEKAVRLRAQRLRLQEVERRKREPPPGIEIVAPSFVLPRTYIVPAPPRGAPIITSTDYYGTTRPVPTTRPLPQPLGSHQRLPADNDLDPDLVAIGSFGATGVIRPHVRARSAESPAPEKWLAGFVMYGDRPALPSISSAPTSAVPAAR